MYNYIKNNYVIIVSFSLIFLAGIISGITLYSHLLSVDRDNGVVIRGGDDSSKNNSQQDKSKDQYDNPFRSSNDSGSEIVAGESLVDKSENQSSSPIQPLVIFPTKVKMKDRAYHITKGDVLWHKPVILKNLKLTTDEVFKGCNFISNKEEKQKCLTNGLSQPVVKYIKVGKVVDGEYNGYDFIIVVMHINVGMDGENSIGEIRFLKKDKKVVFLIDGLEEHSKIKIKDNFLEGDFDYIVDYGTVLDELVAPETIEVGRGKLIKNKYDKAFFESSKLTKSFNSPYYGQIWMTDHKKINGHPTKYELNSYLDYDVKNKKFVKRYSNIFEKEAFFIKLPDGLAVSYKLDLDIFDDSNILKATWDNGVVNEDSYQIRPSGCGGGDYYVFNVTGEINLNTQLIQVGHSILGDPIFGYKDDTSKLFQDFYKNRYHAPSGEKKAGLKKVLSQHLQVFWVDPFGRLLTFYKITDISNMAECGKPVIYLYPEKTMEVQVEVKPNEGISKSEPQYSSTGWKVLASPKGKLMINGKTYPYLFWEGSSDVPYSQSSLGWVVKKENLNNFFDNKLKKLGLIKKEINDFKEFWLPEMTKNNKPYYFITFLPQRKINQLAPLNIIPKPQTIIRVMIDYRELDKKEEVVSFDIKTPERKGFTVVEWGGMLKGNN